MLNDFKMIFDHFKCLKNDCERFKMVLNAWKMIWNHFEMVSNACNYWQKIWNGFKCLTNDLKWPMQAFWRCSVCRRRSRDVPHPIIPTISTTVTRSGGASQRWSDQNRASAEDVHLMAPCSAPVLRRDRRHSTRSTTSTSNDPTPIKDQKICVHSVEDLRNVHPERRKKTPSVSNLATHKTSMVKRPTSSTSASESSLEDQFHHHHRDLSPHDARLSKSRDTCLYLSADDACLASRRDRRYSSESSDTSEASSPMAHRRIDCRPDVETFSTSSTACLLPSTRRRLSFRAKWSRPFYDVDTSDGYDADEQSGCHFIFFICLSARL